MNDPETLKNRTEEIAVVAEHIEDLRQFTQEMTEQLDLAALTPTVTNEGAQMHLEEARERGRTIATFFLQVADRLDKGAPVTIVGQDDPENEGKKLYRVTTGFHVSQFLGQGELDLFLGAIFHPQQANRVDFDHRGQNIVKKERFTKALSEGRVIALTPPARPGGK